MRLLQVFILGSQPVCRTRSHTVNQAKTQVRSQEPVPRLWAKPRSSHRISTSELASEWLLNPGLPPGSVSFGGLLGPLAGALQGMQSTK